MLLPHLCLLITVTFSTPTGDYTHNLVVGAMAMFRQSRGVQLSRGKDHLRLGE
jgi:hypothetical protein